MGGQDRMVTFDNTKKRLQGQIFISFNFSTLIQYTALSTVGKGYNFKLTFAEGISVADFM